MITKSQAIEKINERLREESHYTFVALRDRFVSAYKEYLKEPDGGCCIKIPSGTEFDVEPDLLRIALGR